MQYHSTEAPVPTGQLKFRGECPTGAGPRTKLLPDTGTPPVAAVTASNRSRALVSSEEKKNNHTGALSLIFPNSTQSPNLEALENKKCGLENQWKRANLVCTTPVLCTDPGGLRSTFQAAGKLHVHSCVWALKKWVTKLSRG